MDTYAKLLGNAMQKETRHPQIVSNGYAQAGTHLELPLGRHDLRIGAGHLNAGVQASPVMSIDNVACIDLSKRRETNH